MGVEANRTAKFAQKVSTGKVLLEAETLIFRAALRLSTLS